jgi:hypothetical protein
VPRWQWRPGAVPPGTSARGAAVARSPERRRRRPPAGRRRRREHRPSHRPSSATRHGCRGTGRRWPGRHRSGIKIRHRIDGHRPAPVMSSIAARTPVRVAGGTTSAVAFHDGDAPGDVNGGALNRRQLPGGEQAPVDLCPVVVRVVAERLTVVPVVEKAGRMARARWTLRSVVIAAPRPARPWRFGIGRADGTRYVAARWPYRTQPRSAGRSLHGPSRLRPDRPSVGRSFSRPMSTVGKSDDPRHD